MVTVDEFSRLVSGIYAAAVTPQHWEAAIREISHVLDGTGAALFIPAGFAHGFQTLEDNTEVFYQMSQPYAAECARGVRWNDPSFAVEWPSADRIILERDRNYPDFVARSGGLAQ